MVSAMGKCSQLSETSNQDHIIHQDHSIQLEVFPNPTTELLNISTSQKGKYSVHVINYMGQKFFEQEFTNESQLDVKSLANGHYLIEVKSLDDDGITITKSFVKQ